MPRQLRDQVVVITGASSGVGRETALRFGKLGAAVVLAARNREALDEAGAQVERAGGRAQAVEADVSDWEQVMGIVRSAMDRFGRIDTWINNAAVSTYATVEESSPEELERVIRVNLMGQIYGSKAAFAQMKTQGYGTIINVASVLAVRSVPLQAAYCASKHGVKGFTEALRLEAGRENADIRVCLVMPSSINTPLFGHARSKLGVMPKPIPPVYEAAVVAEALVELARSPARDVVVGGAGKLLALMERLSPGLLDWYMLQGDRMVTGQRSEKPDDGKDNLFQPSEGRGSTEGDFGDGSKGDSPYTRLLEQHPRRKAGLIAGVAVGLASIAVRMGR